MIALLLGLSPAVAADGLFLANPLRPTLEGALLVVETAELPERWEGRLSAVLAHNAVVAYGADSLSPLVQDMLTLHASGAARWGPVRAGVSVPAGVLLRADGLERPLMAASDPELSLKVSPLSDQRVGLALLAGVTIPLGGETAWLGQSGYTAEAGLAASARPGPWTLALNAGLRRQPDEDLMLGSEDESPSLEKQAWAGLGVGRDLGVLGALSVELVGATGLSPRFDGQTSPLEGLLTWRRAGALGRSVHVGLGMGILPGLGAPASRLVVSVGQRPGPAAQTEAPAESATEPSPQPAL